MTAPKPLINNNGPQANAQANYNYKIERKEEEREVSTRPETVEPSLEEKRASSEVPSETPSTIPQSPAPHEGPFLTLHSIGRFRICVRRANSEEVPRDDRGCRELDSDLAWLAVRLLREGYCSMKAVEKWAKDNKWRLRTVSDVI